jgi:UDP-glucose 4-epimerase
VRVLITGGAGFIGSTLARRLLASGNQIVVADNLSTGLRANVPEGAIFVETDLSKPASLANLPSGAYDAVAHLAAQSSGALGQRDPYADMQGNVAATVLLSRWCLERKIPRFLYASSMTVYGEENREPLAENATCRPIGYYGASKLASENYLRVASAEGLNVTSFRLYNVYGPGQNLANLDQGMVSIYLAYMLKGVPVPVTGSLDRYRDFVYVDDVVDLLAAALARARTPSDVYNVGTGKRTTVRELLALLLGAMKLSADYPISELAGSRADLFGSIADPARAESELGWRPRVALAQGLAGMVAWARTQI